MLQLIEQYRDYLQPFCEATIHTLSKQFGIPVREKGMYIKKEAIGYPSIHGAMVALHSRTHQGYVAVCFREEVLLKLMSEALREKFTEVCEEVEDGARSILNMVLGGARTNINHLNDHQVCMNIPDHINDSSPITHVPLPAIVVEFESEFGELTLLMGSPEHEPQPTSSPSNVAAP